MSAFAILDQATEKHLASKYVRTLSEKKVAAEKDKSAVLLATAVTKGKKVPAKEKQGNLAALADLEKRWKKKMDEAIKQVRWNHAENKKKMTKKLTDKDMEIEKDRIKNQDR